MKKIPYYLFYLPFLAGMMMISSCGDDDDDDNNDDDMVAPEGPTVTLAGAASDANRGQEVSITGTVTAPAGLASLEANIEGVTISGASTGETSEQSFTATFTVPQDAEIEGQIAITFTATDDSDQDASATYTITVIPQGAPTITLTGDNTASAKRRTVVPVALAITAAEGIEQLVVTDASGATVATVNGANITDPSSYTFNYTVPDTATPGNDVVLTLNVTDALNRTTVTAATFTVTVLAFDAVSMVFADFNSGDETTFNQGSSNTINLTVSKDALVNFSKINVAREVNGGSAVVSSVDVSGETGATIAFSLMISEVFLDKVVLTLNIEDEFGSTSMNIQLSYDVLSPDGNTFLISDETVGSTAVKKVVGTITENVTFDAMNDYYMSGTVEVENNATLSIPAGTKIYMDTQNNTKLDIDDSGIVNITGTSNNPVVFTSGASIEGGSAAAGDWVGIEIGGGDGVNSGTFQYVRIEYAGDGEPALEFDLVDDMTTISHIQVFESDDQGIEVNGGNVHLSNIMVTNADAISIELDDDDDVGFQGSLQFVIIESSSVLSKGGRDLEVRDDAQPVLSNLTLIGPGKSSAPSADDDISGIRIRSSAGAIKFYNMIIAEYSDDGFRQDNTGDISDINGTDVVAHSYIFQIDDDPTRDDNDPNQALAYETSMSFNNVIDADNIPMAAAGIGVGDFVPDAQISSSFDPTGLGSQFSAGSFVGAINPSSDWTTGWSLNADGTAR